MENLERVRGYYWIGTAFLCTMAAILIMLRAGQLPEKVSDHWTIHFLMSTMLGFSFGFLYRGYKILKNNPDKDDPDEPYGPDNLSGPNGGVF